MNASTIIKDDMTLEEKLAAIDAAMVIAQESYNIKNGRPVNAPVDPSELTMCEGCQ